MQLVHRNQASQSRASAYLDCIATQHQSCSASNHCLPGSNLLALIVARLYKIMSEQTFRGSCLKTGQHFIFVIIYLLLPINCIILDSVSKILFNFFIANNNNYDSNNENIAP